MLTGYSIFIFIIFLLLISWALVTFWQRFLENLFFNTLGFNPDGTVSMLIVAILATTIFLIIVWLIKYLEIIPNIDLLIFDYNEDTYLGGYLGNLNKRLVTGKISPRGALFLSNQN